MRLGSPTPRRHPLRPAIHLGSPDGEVSQGAVNLPRLALNSPGDPPSSTGHGEASPLGGKGYGSPGEQGTWPSLQFLGPDNLCGARESREDGVPTSPKRGRVGNVTFPSVFGTGQPSQHPGEQGTRPSLFFSRPESREEDVPCSPAARRAGNMAFPAVLGIGKPFRSAGEQGR